MILKYLNYPIIGLVAILLTSCSLTYGDNISSSITRFSNDSCVSRANNIALYFDNEKINFEYDKIGLVEATSNEYSSNEKILNHIKYEAWSNCANAIINIKIYYKDRETGTLLSDEETRRNYTSTVFTGIAVRMKNDSVKAQIDTSFVQKVRADYQVMNQKSSDQMTVSVIGTIAVLFLAILLL